LREQRHPVGRGADLGADLEHPFQSRARRLVARLLGGADARARLLHHLHEPGDGATRVVAGATHVAGGGLRLVAALGDVFCVRGDLCDDGVRSVTGLIGHGQSV